MRKITFLAITAITVLCLSCKKDKQTQDYYMRADKNNVSWNVKSAGYFVPLAKRDSLQITGSTSTEGMIIRLATNPQKEYTLDNNKTFYYITSANASLLAKYTIDNTVNNAVQVSKIDTINGVISGTFNLSLKKASGDNTFPENMTFKNGEFRSQRITAFID